VALDDPNPPSASDFDCKCQNCSLFKPRYRLALHSALMFASRMTRSNCSYCGLTKAPNDPPHILNRAPWGAVRSHSEIRLIRTRNRGVFPCIIFMRVFGTDKFLGFVQRAPISDSRRPGHRENAFILDRKLEL
jgi:hypothetical protein